MTNPALTLGPCLFNWKPETLRDFYFRIADEAPVTIVYLGEIICSKRAPLFEPQMEAGEMDRAHELELEVVHLMEEVERYRSAAEDALQQLDWCIGYLAGCQKGRVARVLSANGRVVKAPVGRPS